MAANNKQIGATIVLRAGNFFANAKKASASLKGLKAKFNSGTSASGKFSSGISAAGNSLSSLAKKAVGAATAYVGFRQTKDFLTDCVTGVMELERANTRLETLMMNVSGTTKAQVKDLIDYGDALELCTTIEGDATMAGASQLATFQLSADTIKTLLPAFQDLAVAQYGVNVSQEQMINSGNLIGKVMNGSVGALTKAGVSFTAEQEKILKTGTESEKAAALVEVLGKNFGGLAQQMAQTDEGRIRQLKNAWGSVKDEVGFAVLPAVSGLVQYLSSNIPNIREKVTSGIEKIKPIAADLWEKTKSGAKTVGNMISWVKDNWAWLEPVIGGVVGAIIAYKTAVSIAAGVQWALNAAMNANPIGLIITAIGALIGIGVVVYKNWAQISAWFVGIWNKIKDGASWCWEGIKGFFSSAGEWFMGLWNGIKDTAVSLWEGIKNVFSAVGEWFGGVFNSASNAVYNAFSNVVGFFQNIWNTIKSMFSSIGTAIADGISGAFKSVINGVIRFAGKLINGFIKSINWAIDVINNIPGVNITKLTSVNLPMLANGGVIRHPGSVLVGERGPEVLRLPRGASVAPLPAGAGGGTYYNTFHVTVNADDDRAAERFVKKVKQILDNM